MATAAAWLGVKASASIPPMKVRPLGKPGAPVAGQFNRSIAGEPENLNPLNSSEFLAKQIHEYVMEGLLYLNPETEEWQPQLAENYSISDDFLTYTFFLRRDATFSDGKTVS